MEKEGGFFAGASFSYLAMAYVLGIQIELPLTPTM